MVYKAKRVSSEKSYTYYTILMPDYDGDTVLSDFKNNFNECLFTTELMDAKKFPSKEEALNFISKELKGLYNAYKIIPIKIEISLVDYNK
ncbi:hypothetical protein CJ195_19065 [Bacillus sp. UMB0899]|nr:hypothetical protein CJ195_19065 [Bacillus sp. UMB0899]